MLCDKCKKNEASVHIRKIQNNGEVQALNLCPPCAFMEFMENSKLLSGISPDSLKLPDGMEEDLLAKLLEGGLPLPGMEELTKKLTQQCKSCGTSLGNLQESGTIGCCNCVNEFRSKIKEMLPAICKEDINVNWNAPVELNQLAQVRDTIDNLTHQMENAVKHERYEQASELKKQIKMNQVRLMELEQEMLEQRSSETSESKERKIAAPKVNQDGCCKIPSFRTPMWCSFESGKKSPHIRLSSCIMMRRNMANTPLPPFKNEKSKAEETRSFLRNILLKDELFSSFYRYDLENLTVSDSNLLVSAGWISREYIESKGPRTLLLDPKRKMTAVINGSDHLSFCFWGKTGTLGAMYRNMQELDSRLGAFIPYWRDEDFGIVTKNIDLMGAGIISCEFLHLPALQIFGNMDAICRACEQMGLRLAPKFCRHDREGNPIYSELTGCGAFYILEPMFASSMPLSKQNELIEKVAAILETYELEKRRACSQINEMRVRCCDMVGKVLGLARHSFLVPTDVARDILSGIWFGVEMGMLPFLSLADVRMGLARVVDMKLEGAKGAKIAERLSLLHASILMRLANADEHNLEELDKFLFQ